MMSCALCTRSKPLQASHIIPEFIYNPSYDDLGRMVGYLIGPTDIRTRLEQQGVREDLLCSECEQQLNRDYEQPSVSIWSYLDGIVSSPPGISEELVRTPKGNSARVLAGVDYKSFNLLLLSILWRSGAASRREFAQVRLEPHQETLRKMVLKGDPGAERAYPMLVSQYRDHSFRAIVLPWH